MYLCDCCEDAVEFAESRGVEECECEDEPELITEDEWFCADKCEDCDNCECDD